MPGQSTIAATRPWGPASSPCPTPHPVPPHIPPPPTQHPPPLHTHPPTHPPQFAKLRYLGCSFLVAGRVDAASGTFKSLADLEMPAVLPSGVRCAWGPGAACLPAELRRRAARAVRAVGAEGRRAGRPGLRWLAAGSPVLHTGAAS